MLNSSDVCWSPHATVDFALVQSEHIVVVVSSLAAELSGRHAALAVMVQT